VVTNDAFDDDPLLADLSALPDPRTDARRAEHTRARCHRILARRRRQRWAWLAPVRPWTEVLEAGFISALALFYLGGAIQRALVLLGH
jgi:hypothetical protein